MSAHSSDTDESWDLVNPAPEAESELSQECTSAEQQNLGDKNESLSENTLPVPEEIVEEDVEDISLCEDDVTIALADDIKEPVELSDYLLDTAAVCTSTSLKEDLPSSSMESLVEIADLRSSNLITEPLDTDKADNKPVIETEAEGGSKQDEWELLRRTPPQFRHGPMLKIQNSASESGSEHSDFVHLDAIEDVEFPYGLGGVLEVSTSSNTSSVSQNFRFVRPVHSRPRVYLHSDDSNDADDDDESLPPDFDDRCESDISGVAEDDDGADESDLSEAGVVDLGDLTISEGDVMRSYKHRPNSSLNTMLTILAVVTLFLAFGVGIGHYIVTVRESMFRQKQVQQMKSLQDEYLMCLRQQEIDEQKYSNTPTTQERISMVMDEWREKYEALILEKVELEQEIQRLEQNQLEELEHAQQQVAASFTHMQSLQTELKQLNQDAQELQQQQLDEDDAELLQQQQNAQLYQEMLHKNAVLRAAEEKLTLKLKELEQQLTAEKNEQEAVGKTVVDMRNELNQLKVENFDLQQVVSRQRYTKHPTNAEEGEGTASFDSPVPLVDTRKDNEEIPSPLVNKNDAKTANEHLWFNVKGSSNGLGYLRERLTQVNQALHEQRGRSARLHTLLMAERRKHLDGCDGQGIGDGNTGPDFFTCITFLIPELNLSSSLKPIFGTTSSMVHEHLQFLQQLKDDPHFLKAFNIKWKELQGYVDSSNWQKFTEQAKQTYDSMKKSVSNKWQEFNLKNGQRFDDVKESLKEEWDNFNSSYFRESAENGFTKARSTIAKLQDRVKATVKNLTGGSRLEKAYNTTKQAMSDLTEHVHDTLVKVKNLSSDFLNKTPGMGKVSESFKKFGKKIHNEWKHMQKKIGKNWFGSERKGAHKKRHYQKPRHYPSAESDKACPPPFFSDIDDKPKQFENKPSHKQKQSTRSEPDSYEEFWKQADFQPDDLIHDGFFEGNNREWRKHQKRLRKLHGRIQQLSEEIFQSLDDDDIDDLYDDLDDLQDDVDDEEKAPEKLKTWLTCQTRWWKSRLYRKHRNQDLFKGCGQFLMKWQLSVICNPICKQGNCHHLSPSLYSFCQYFPPTVISPQKSCKKNSNKNCVVRNANAQGKNDNQGKYHHDIFHSGGDADSKWYFERAQERDNSHQGGQWFSKRANERDFERTKPWYYQRADHRHGGHNYD